MRFLAATILCGLATAACGASAAPATAPLPSTHDFALVYERNGGIAASTLGLTVAPGGFAVVRSSGSTASTGRVKFRLGSRRIRALQRSLRRADLTSIHPGSGGCADCYVYSIDYRGDHVELEEIDVPPRLEDAIAEIEAVISAHPVPSDTGSAGT